MSDLRTVTIRELDREPDVVLDPGDREGRVRVRRGNGRTDLVRPENGPERMTTVPGVGARLAKVVPKPLTRAQTRLTDKLIAGE